MNCQQVQEKLMDMLYGEECDSHLVFSFFEHLNQCGRCQAEYLELLQTREQLATWSIEPLPARETLPKSAASRRASWSRISRSAWWVWTQRVAAIFLMIVGAISILQSMGIGKDRYVRVDQQQLSQMMSDMIEARLESERTLVGKAMLTLGEELDMRRRSDMNQVQNRLVAIQEQYLNNLEQNNRYLKKLANKTGQ